MEEVLQDMNTLLEMHERFGITDVQGEEEMRNELRQQALLLDRHRTYLQMVEERLGAR